MQAKENCSRNHPTKTTHIRDLDTTETSPKTPSSHPPPSPPKFLRLPRITVQTRPSQSPRLCRTLVPSMSRRRIQPDTRALGSRHRRGNRSMYIHQWCSWDGENSYCERSHSISPSTRRKRRNFHLKDGLMAGIG